jgi:hypothetical protein
MIPASCRYGATGDGIGPRSGSLSFEATVSADVSRS